MGLAEKHLAGRLEEIARGLFTVTSEQGGELIGLCPVHGEENPSFSYNPSKDVCNCFACGFTGDIITLWSKVRGYDGADGFKAFCREFDINEGLSGRPKGRADPEKADPPPLDDQYGQLGPLPPDWVKKLARTRGWSIAAMDWLGIRQQSHYREKNTGRLKRLRSPERVAIPVRDDEGRVRNIRLYRPGGRTGKVPKIISWGTDFGETRLFPPAPRDDGAVLLCEGEPDTICALSQGFNAITQTSKPKKWTKAQLAKFKGRDVVIAFDADQPGQKYAREFAAPALAKVARTVRILEWPDFMGRRKDGLWPEKGGQDLTDFFVRHKKKPVDLERLVNEAPHYEPPDPDMAPQHLAFFERGVNDRMSFKPRLLAERLLKDYKLLYCPDTGLLYRWNGRYWMEYFEDHLRAAALKLLGNEARQAYVQDAVFQVKSLSTIPHGRTLNDRLEYLCVKNGMLNINTMDLEDHDPGFYASYELDVSYNPKSKDMCSRLIQYTKETVQTPEAIMQLQEFMGYCFYRDNRFEKYLLLIGDGGDGKSVLLKVLREIIGPENCASVAFKDLEEQFHRSALYQKSVNISTEEASKALESQYIKAITSGDPIMAAFKHKNPFTFTPFCKLIFAVNRIPRVLDNSDGFFRRVLPIRFKRQFKEDDPDRDPFLKEKLLEEKSEIFQWALVGLRRLLRNNRFTDCDETRELLMEYKRLNNPVICFVQDVCELDLEGRTKKATLFENYCRYCRKWNYRAYSRENFFRELYSAWSTLKNTRIRRPDSGRAYYVQGIRITEVIE